jgi:hypothetical protein
VEFAAGWLGFEACWLASFRVAWASPLAASALVVAAVSRASDTALLAALLDICITVLCFVRILSRGFADTEISAESQTPFRRVGNYNTIMRSGELPQPIIFSWHFR